MKSIKLIKLDTRSSRIRAHRKLWRWLNKNPNKHKYDWPGWESNGGRYPDQFISCFFCIYPCNKCPVEFPPKSGCLGGLFFDWVQSPHGSKRRAIYAKQIAELPVRRIK